MARHVQRPPPSGERPVQRDRRPRPPRHGGPPRPAAPIPSRPGGLDQLEGRNPVSECLQRRRREVHRVLVDEAARSHPKLDALLQSAAARGIPVQRVPREALDAMSETGVHNGVIAWTDPLPSPSLSQHLDALQAAGREPFIVLVDEPQYEHNLGAVLRSALGAGVSAVVVPAVRGKGVSAVVQRVAMGAAEEVPVIREGLSSCLAQLARRGVRIVGVELGGEPLWRVDLRGPLALVLGGEDKSLTAPLRKRCEAIATIPTQGGLQSLNLSVSAAVLMFERLRQLGAGGPQR
ncbi:MAG: RNA methyltransferase [Pseudomonadota bacterium]